MTSSETSNPSNGVVRLAKRSEADRIATTLAQAFVDDPVVSYVMRNVSSMDTWNKYFRVGVDVAFEQGEVWTTGDVSGACLFFAPGQWRINLWMELKAALRIARAFDLTTTLNIRSIFHRLEGAHPTEPHYYLLAVGVTPARRNRGLGGALLRPMLDRCSHDHAPACLENSNPKNRHFYEHRGFKLTRSMPLPNATPPVDLMWRAAGVSAS